MSQKDTHAAGATTTASATSGSAGRYLIVGLLVVLAFFASYRFAQARNAGQATQGVVSANGAAGGTGAAKGAAGSSGTACACCGDSSAKSSTPITGGATIEGSVQKITVDTSTGSYNPNVITLKAGVPAEITFGQATGCLSQVISDNLGFSEDLSTGDKTVEIANPQPGEYQFYCGMQMTFGKIVVE
jgi:hypothetical protein